MSRHLRQLEQFSWLPVEEVIGLENGLALAVLDVASVSDSLTHDEGYGVRRLNSELTEIKDFYQ